MEIKIIPQPPHAQCCVGFETDVDILDKVCHHCGRAICNQHHAIPILAEGFMPNPEYRFLGLLGEEEQPASHCPECASHPSGWRNFGRKCWRIVGGLLGSDWLQKHWYLGRYRPALPTTPDVTGIALEEKFEGTITLNADGVYLARPQPPTGEIKVNFRFMERERSGWASYCHRYGVSPADLATAFHAGFGILKDGGNLVVDLPPEANFNKTGALEFRGQLADIEFFQAQPPTKNVWPAKFTYTIVRGDKKEVPLPLRLTPTILPNDDGCSFELAIQSNLDTGTSPDLATLRIDELTIEAPAQVSNIVQVYPFTTVSKWNGNGGEPSKVEITWQGGLELSKEAPQTSVRVRYAKRLESHMTVKGKLKVSGIGTLSGLKDVRLFYPWGQRRPAQPNPNRKCTITVEFEFNLSKVRFQDVLVKTGQRDFQGFILEAPIIQKLTKNLDAASLYVKRVVENPARVNKNHAQLVNRFWDISGRSYIDSCAVDFHLRLTGEHHVALGRENELGFAPTGSAILSGDNRPTVPRPHENKVKVAISLQGAASNAAMRQQVESVFADLLRVVENTFR